MSADKGDLQAMARSVENAFGRIELEAGREGPSRKFHPWIFSGAVRFQSDGIAEGDIVEVYSSKNEFLGVGFFSASSIAVKLFSFKKITPDAAYWSEKIRAALKLRRDLGVFASGITNAYRLINAEGDGAPGLIIDLYNDCAVVQFHHVGMLRLREHIASALDQIFAGEIQTIYSKSAETLKAADQFVSDLPNLDFFLKGSASQTEVLENGLRFEVNWVEGQKTGFFVDQRENRQIIRNLAQGRSVLNTFSYTGGFSVAAMIGGATSVDSVDSSASALQLLQRNVELNGITAGHTAHQADCFEYLKQTSSRFELIVLDPPPFAKSRQHLDRALSGYRALNHQGIRILEKGGYLASFSCSGVVDRAAFYETVRQAAIDLGRQAVLIKELGAPVCHPLSLHHPEGGYLKGCLVRVL